MELRIFFIALILLVGCETQLEDPILEESKSSEGSLLSKAATKGKNILEDGSVYEGDLVRGLPHGFGLRKFSNEDFYEGQFEEGLAHGHGTIRYKSDPNLEKYVGMWSSGLREGFGTLFFADSSLMVGHWKNDAFYYGEFQRSDGTLISGKWTRESLSEGKVRDEFGNIFTGVFNEKGGIWKGTYKL